MFRAVSTSVVIMVLLALVGAIAGPSWAPEPVTDQIIVTHADTRILSDEQTPGVGTYPVSVETVTVDLGGMQVEAIVRTPVGAPAGMPGIVFVHGAGTGQPQTAFTTQAHDLASAGVATLVPAKRLDNYSTRHRDYVEMAGDYAASVEHLRGVPGVDPERVGVYAESEGTWIAPVMATADPSIAFLALVSAPVVPPRSQAAFAVDSYLRNTRVPHGVFRAIPRAVGMEMPGGGFEYADFDVRPYLDGLTRPVLVVYGTADLSMPTVQGAQEILERVSPSAGVVVRYYAGANHGIRVDDRVVPELDRDLAAWVHGQPATAHAVPQVAGAQPSQAIMAAEVPRAHWFGSGDRILGAAVVAGVLMTLGPLVWLGAWVLGGLRRGPRRGEGAGVRRARAATARVHRSLQWWLPGVALATLATAAGLVWYLVMVGGLALEYQQDPWLVQGGWVAVRLGGVLAAVLGALLLNTLLTLRARRRQGECVRAASGVLAYATVGGVVAGTILLWMLLAYWGVFQLGI
ncbi:MAG: alpha/beta hydrolase family protein [Cellulomonadaceae bacterium]